MPWCSRRACRQNRRPRQRRLLLSRCGGAGGIGRGDHPDVLGDRVRAAGGHRERQLLPHRLGVAAGHLRVGRACCVAAQVDRAGQPRDDAGAQRVDGLPSLVRGGVETFVDASGQRRRGAIDQIRDLSRSAPSRDELQAHDRGIRTGTVSKYCITQIGDMSVGRCPRRRGADHPRMQVKLLLPVTHLPGAERKVRPAVAERERGPGGKVGALLHLAGRLGIEPGQRRLSGHTPARISLPDRWHPDAQLTVAGERRRA
jgi:hypothetical protein